MRRLVLMLALIGTIGALAWPGDADAGYRAFRGGVLLTVRSDDAGADVNVTCDRGRHIAVNGLKVGEASDCAVTRIVFDMGAGTDHVNVQDVNFRGGFPNCLITGTLGAGDDQFRGSTGGAPVTSSDCEIRMRGGPGTDLLLGGRSNDVLYGDTGRGVLAGQGGNDALVGGPDPDKLDVGTLSVGNDRLYGGGGRNLVGRSETSSLGQDLMTTDCPGIVRARDRDPADRPDTIVGGGRVARDRVDRRLKIWCGILASQRDSGIPSFRQAAAGGVLQAAFARTSFRATRALPTLILPPGSPPGGTPPGGKPQCSDGVDNDGDGRIDFSPNPASDVGPDPDCSSPDDNSEAASSASAALLRPAARAPAGSILRFEISGPASRLEIRVRRLLSGISRRPGRRPCGRRSAARLRQIRREIARGISPRIRGSARRRRISRGLARRRCHRLSRGGTVALDNPRQGPGQANFTGRVGGRPLRAGRYLAIIRTVDPEGKRSVPTFATFRVVR